MPNFDGTGPDGRGPMGRGRGPCANPNLTGFKAMRRSWSKCVNRGFARFGRRAWMQDADMNADNPVYSYDKTSLQNEKNRLEKMLSWITDRLAELDR
ncbi:MAG: DUF5320 domain-containing protein [Candidatus Cloacimonadaceae bacterium]|nr:DUF5320 domain-containing protein [Candidatus Cloacimonadaceae bacterium]